MTTTLITRPSGRLITRDIHERLNRIKSELNAQIQERQQVISGLLVFRVAQQHMLMIGPAGTGKSFTARSFAGHISDSKYFEAALDESSDPSQVFGPINPKRMLQDGKIEFNIEGMLPDATDGFIDEVFNGNQVVLHSLQPLANERVIHQLGKAQATDVRQILFGTNKLTTDTETTPFWDRIHGRYFTDYVTRRSSKIDMVTQHIARQSQSSDRTKTRIEGENFTTVTLAELDTARQESLALHISDEVEAAFYDLIDDVRLTVPVSDRRMCDAMNAVLANSWMRGHEEVSVNDLDILAAMLWNTLEERVAVQATVLERTDPGQKAALDLLDACDEVWSDLRSVPPTGEDRDKIRDQGIEAVVHAEDITKEASEIKATLELGGADTDRIDEVIEKCEEIINYVGENYMGLIGPR